MIADLEPIIEKYEALVKQVDEVFEKVRSDYPDCVKCKLECADCCHALFDLSLVEALYVNLKFLETLGDEKNRRFLNRLTGLIARSTNSKERCSKL